MYRFWDAIIEPALDRLEPQVIVEIGADFGFNTRNLLEYARRTGATLHVIDPLPKFDVDEWAATYPGTLLFHGAPSLEVLSSIAQPDVVLIDGDHNWHTVFHELKALQDSADTDSSGYPLVLLHDLGWPYGRRDLYYEPDRIPEPHRQPYEKGGLRLGRESLDPDGGLNAHLFNAVRAGGPRNGVLTAVEDFMREAPFELGLIVVPGINDLGILFPTSLRSRNRPLSDFFDELTSGTPLRQLLGRVEALRVDAQIESSDLQRSIRDVRAQLVSQIKDLRNEASALNRQVVERDKKLSDLAAEMQSNVQALNLELDSSNQEISQLEGAVRELEDALVDKNAQLEKERSRIASLGKSLKRAERAQAKALRDYRRLRGRRSVRLALGLARLFRPLFRWRRRTIATPPKEVTTGVGASAPLEEPRERPHRELTEENPNLVPDWWDVSTGTPFRPEAITIIVPIFNAYDELRRCIDSLLRNTRYPAQVLLIDDASTDARIAPFLQELSLKHDNVRTLTNEINLGFVATVNRGFSETQGDVVILNSDVEVVPGWLRRIALAARAHPQAATVTPLSDNAGAFSAPSPGEKPSLPQSLTRDEIGRLVAREALRLYPLAPTGNGFCMFVRRAALDECGLFDEEAFPRGYGEENDFCMKALRAGWTHVVDDATYVFHERSSSFGEEKASLAANARKMIDARYPEYTGLVREFLGSAAMTGAVDAVGAAFGGIEYGAIVRPRLLTVIHRAGGGTPATNLDLMRALSNRYDPLQLSCDTRQLILERLVDGVLERVGAWSLGGRVAPTDFSRRDYRSLVARILRDFDIELVHIRHLIGHTFDLPEVAQAFGIPVVLSVHDFYYICPTVHLIDDQQRFCGGQCTPGQGSCVIPTAWLTSVPHLKHAWVYEWRDRVAAMFEHIDAFVTASPSARETYISAFPGIERRFNIIEHGRDDKKHDGFQPPIPSLRRPVRILVPGNLDFHKGGDFLEAIKRHDRAGRLEFHFAGRSRQHYGKLGVHHGVYERDDWFDLVGRVRPSFVGLFSITAETFSHTLSEAWLAGLPVIATDLGAFKDRIGRDGGGWLIDARDPKRACEQILEIVDDTDAFRDQIANIPISALRTAEQMAADYSLLYKQLLAKRNPFSAEQTPHSPLRVGLFILGKEGARPASTYIRVLRRCFHPSLEQDVAPVLLNPATYVEMADRVDLDVALVQRTAVPPEVTNAFIDALKRQSVPLILDLDDDLLTIGFDHPDYGEFAPYAEPIRQLVSSAALVTVSTDVLRRAYSQLNSKTMVVLNQLDEHLWSSPVDTSPSEPPPDDDRLRILYFGSLTHSADLEILRAAVEGFESEVAVTVIGGAEEGSLNWCRQLVPDRRWNQYPDFVHWLRQNASGFDAVAIPLADTPFNKAKSDLKFLEAAALGLPVICSRVDAYAATIIDGETGLLVSNNPAAWREAISRLKSEPSMRTRIASAALDYVQSKRLLGQHVNELKRTLEESLG